MVGAKTGERQWRLSRVSAGNGRASAQDCSFFALADEDAGVRPRVDVHARRALRRRVEAHCELADEPWEGKGGEGGWHVSPAGNCIWLARAGAPAGGRGVVGPLRALLRGWRSQGERRARRGGGRGAAHQPGKAAKSMRRAVAAPGRRCECGRGKGLRLGLRVSSWGRWPRLESRARPGATAFIIRDGGKGAGSAEQAKRRGRKAAQRL